MKRILLFFVVILPFACVGVDESYLKSFNNFIEGLQKRDIKLINEFSTETTSSMIRKVISSDKTTYILVDDGSFGKVVSGKSILQHEIAIIRDSISDDGRTARVWFTLYDSDDVCSLNLVHQRNRWLVDIPLERFILY